MTHRELWVLRHGKAAADGPDGTDRSRPLAPRGRRQGAEVARYAEKARAAGRVTPTLVLSSSAARAASTAELVMPGLGDSARLVTESELYDADVDDIVARLRLVDDDEGPVMVVGHNPVLHELALLVLSADDTDGRRRLEEGFPTSALAVLDTGADRWPVLSLGQGRLHDLFVPPR